MSFRMLGRAGHLLVPFGLVAAFAVGGSVSAFTRPSAVTAPQPQVVAPAVDYVPGARVLNLGIADLFPLTSGPECHVVGAGGAWNLYAYGSSCSIGLRVDLPADASLVQIDLFSYATANSSWNWELVDLDGTTTSGTNVLTIPISGNGMIHSVAAFAGTPITLETGHTWMIGGPSTSAETFAGAVLQYTLPTLSLTPVTPFRVVDTRFARFGGRIAKGGSRSFKLVNSIDTGTGASLTLAVPAGTKAVAYNLTVTGTEGSGWAAILPGKNTAVTASAINWTGANQTLANGGIVALGTGANERYITIVVGGSSAAKANFILDITGLYASEEG